MTILLPKFANRFDHQKGAIFGFGSSAANEPHGGVLKIMNISQETLKTMDFHVPVHNLAQE